MKHFQFIGKVDVDPINKQIEEYPELWDQFSLRRESKVHAAMSDVWLRFNAWENYDPEHPEKFVDKHDSVFYDAWYKLTSIHQLVYNLMWSVRATKLGGCLITQIPAGGHILPHNDRGSWHPEYYDTKIYVILKSNPDCIFRCEDEEVAMEAGEIWTINNLVEHEVRNGGASPRRTLIISTSTK